MRSISLRDLEVTPPKVTHVQMSPRTYDGGFLLMPNTPERKRTPNSHRFATMQAALLAVRQQEDDK